jgi:hypothetical protein
MLWIGALFSGGQFMLRRKKERYHVMAEKTVEGKLTPRHRLKERQFFRSIGI